MRKGEGDSASLGRSCPLSAVQIAVFCMWIRGLGPLSNGGAGHGGKGSRQGAVDRALSITRRSPAKITAVISAWGYDHRRDAYEQCDPRALRSTAICVVNISEPDAARIIVYAEVRGG
jgi:hypothetical protein